MAARLEQLLVPTAADLRTALSLIDENSLGVVFVVDESGRFRGLLTDGDIRRALLRGIGLDAPVHSVMRVDCVTLPHDTPPQTILASLNQDIAVIPLLNAEGRPVDYASHRRHHRLPVMEPELSGNELNYVVECIRTNWISSQGPFVGRFENQFARYLGVAHALAVSNGTAALHLALAALGVGVGDEVLLPDLTFAASINAILYVGATPVLVDVRRDTWTLDPEGVERAITPRTRAIMPVHLYGQPCEMAPLIALARAKSLLVIEDAAEALGAEYRGRPVGQFGDAAAYSFYGNKLITTGEGGGVTFRERAVFDRARRLRDHGTDPGRRYWHEEVGYNYRLTNLQAAVGLAQLERIETFIGRKLELASWYRQRLSRLEGLLLPVERPDTRNIFWLYSVVIESSRAGLDRDELMGRLLLSGIETRPFFHPLHQMPPYRRFAGPGAYPNSEWLAANGLSLPSAVTMDEKDVEYVTDEIQRVLAGRRTNRAERVAP